MINPPNVPRHRYQPSQNVKRRRLNVNFFGIELDSDDLLTEILIRLPVKSLSRFKCVCKKWLSVISSDYFCHQHTLRRPRLQPSLLLLVNNYRDFFYLNPTTKGEKKMIPYTGSFPDFDCTIMQACNGLVLLQSLDCYYVHNLTTRRSRKISLNRNDEYARVAGFGLAFDPSKSPYYKIVCVYPSNPEEDRFSGNDELMTSFRIEVYDSESHSWKLGLEAASLPNLFYRKDCKTLYCNNKIYWQSCIGCCYFDIDKNEMKTLTFLENRRPATSPWLLKHDGRVDQYYVIVGFTVGSDGDESCRLLTLNGRKIGVYSFRDQTHKNVIDLNTLPCFRLTIDQLTVTGFQFGETLALV